jgi:hemolysin-activating ACP:hemolysin acyltransferase
MSTLNITDASLGLMRIKDPNEALGLAVRLLAGEAPFRDMPLGVSIGSLVGSIDAGNYIFASRGDRAVGVTFWMFTQPEDAEAWLFRGKRLSEDALTKGGPAAIILGLQATETEVTRLLFRGLRDIYVEVDLCYFMRDYGKDDDRGRRAVRLVRPKVRRKPKDAAQVGG